MSRSSAPFSPVQSRRRAAWYAQRGGTGAAVAAQEQTAQQVPASLQEVAAGDQLAAIAAGPAPASSAAAAEAASQPAARLAAAAGAAAAEASATRGAFAGASDLAGSAAAAAPHAASDGSSRPASSSSASGSAQGPGQPQGQASHAKKLGLKGGFGIGKKRLRKGGNIFGAAAAEVLRFAPLCARV